MKFLFSLIILTLSLNCTQYNGQSGVDISIWYGLEQSFGHIGNAQRQINILGNISSDLDTIVAYFTLNESADRTYLTLGSDLHRLAEKGDFNIEIERDELKEGKNLVRLFVKSNGEVLEKKNIEVNYYGQNKWPLPYSVQWKDVNKIQDVAEIVDGHWELQPSGLRTKFKYYDRIIAMGDSNWRNYEVETSVIFHDFTRPVEGPPTYNVSHVAIASRWPGHAKDELQPNRQWFPLGATSEFRITSDYDSCRWRIFDGEHFYAEQKETAYRTIKPEVKYKMKHRVEDLPDGKTQYSVKFWKADLEEPSDWDFQAVEASGLRESGSACIIAHNTDVTFGDVFIRRVQ